MTSAHSTARSIAARKSRWLIQAAVAAALSGSFATGATGAEPAAADSDGLEEVQITGSRIVRRDTESTSPLITVEKEILEKSSYISIEQALNELPQFMAGGALNGAGAVTGLTAAGDVMGGAGTGNMFDTARPVDNARAGQFTPGAATVNLRGLGPNRNIVLIDGRRGVPTNASGALDLNTVPQIAIGNIEVITGGASSVYGADALAGVTNIKLRNNFQGLEVRARGGINEAGGDGKEWQFSTLMGVSLGGEGHAMVAMDYSKRQISYWKNRSYFREVMESPLSDAGDYLFGWYPAYAPGTLTGLGGATCASAGTGCTTTSLFATAGGGSNNVFNRVWAGNGPSQNAINTVFSDRTCAPIACVGSVIPGVSYAFNADGTLFTTSSQFGTGANTLRYGPQSFTGQLGGTEANPDELRCTYTTAPGANAPVAALAGFPTNCNPTLGRVDYGRRLTSPRDGFTLLGSADYNITEHITAYSAITFATSRTETRREPSPTSGNWRVSIPFSSNPNQVYLPSVAQAATGGLAIGDTLLEYRAGGKRGTNCAPTGGCTMAQAFPVPSELRTLLASRPDVTLNNVNSIYNGRSVCTVHTSATADQVDPNTGLPYTICGPNSAWGLANTLSYMPPRGTDNQQTDYQLSAGLKGDLGLSDWTWDTYLSQGESRTVTNYVGYISNAAYSAIITAPNYGQGFSYASSTSNKALTCTSGLNPFKQAAGTLVVSQDCINALTANQDDRQSMRQFEAQLNLQGKVFELPAGDVRSAVGVSWRKNTFEFLPDSLRESDYPFDGPAGQFGVANIYGQVAVKEIYGELLVPLLKDLPAVRSLELELGYRYSQYTTGQDVPTFKAQLSWEPLSWVRLRGGYNRAERTPNIAELYTLPTTSSQLTTGADPCSTLNGATLPRSNSSLNTNTAERAQLQALCLAMINRDGGNNASQWNTVGPTAFAPPPPAVVTFRGDPNLKSEQGDTWTAGLVLSSPFEHPLAQRLTTTIDWYKIKIADPIDVLSSQFVMNACFNQDGSNPTYSLSNPYCNLITRDPVTGGITSTNTIYANIGELSVSGIDVTTRWSAPLADMGMSSLPGTFSVTMAANILTEQNQPVTVGGALQNYAGYVGGSKFRLNTVLGYNWNSNRVNLTWLYRQGTSGLDATNRPSALFADYPSGSLFNLMGGTSFGPLDVTVNVSNILNTEPKRAGWALADTYNGFGTFDPYGDLVGRRYSVNLTMKF